MTHEIFHDSTAINRAGLSEFEMPQRIVIKVNVSARPSPGTQYT